MELYLIRHGQSANNILTDMTHRVCDPPLTELGQLQADALAVGLRAGGLLPQSAVSLTEPCMNGRHPLAYRITRLYCSPMQRALQTARPLAEALDLSPLVWVDIHEHGGVFLDHGDPQGVVGYPGYSREEILRSFPGYRVPDEIDGAGWWHGQMEQWSECQARAEKVARQIRDWATQDAGIALVSHAGFLDALLQSLMSVPGDGSVFFQHCNTGVTRVDFFPDGHLQLRYLNRLDHLPVELLAKG
jgi:2,3-bisphosphoglycerate-dependent phosphoglycerate mutase